MKKTMIAALAALAMASSAYAGNSAAEDSGFSFIPQFGMNISNFRMDELPLEGMNPKVGFNIGIHAEYMLPECYGIYVNAGLEYSMKGAKERIYYLVDDEYLPATGIVRAYYLQLPIHIGYRYNVLDNLGVYADLGPYFALGTNGKYIIKKDNFAEDESDNFFTKNDYIFDAKRGEIGFGFRIGAEYAKHYNIIFSCDWGLTNMLTQEYKHNLVMNNEVKDPSVKNFAAAITVGYRF